MNRRTLLDAAAVSPLAVPLSSITSAKESLPVVSPDDVGYITFHVYDGNPPGCLAWRADEYAIEKSSAHVIGFETVGMPETYDTIQFTPVTPPVPLAEWLRGARFPRDAWGEPTFVRVFYQEAR